MPTNPAIEEKAKAFTNNTPTTETDAEFLQRSYEFAQDIYQLGVSESPLKDLLEARAWISNKIANHNHSYEFSATKIGALEEERDRLEKLIDSLTKTP